MWTLQTIGAAVENARVYGNAKIYDNAIIAESAQVYDSAKIGGNAMVKGKLFVPFLKERNRKNFAKNFVFLSCPETAHSGRGGPAADGPIQLRPPGHPPGQAGHQLGFKLHRPAGDSQTARLLDELPLQQQAHGVGAVHPPPLVPARWSLPRRIIEGELVVQPAQHVGHGLEQIGPVMDVAVYLIGLDRLGHLGQIVPANLIAAVQGGDHRFDLQIVLVALAGLQGRDQLYHLEHVVKAKAENLEDFTGPLDLILHLLSKNTLVAQNRAVHPVRQEGEQDFGAVQGRQGQQIEEAQPHAENGGVATSFPTA